MVLFNRKIDKKHKKALLKLTRNNRNNKYKHLLIDTDSENTISSCENTSDTEEYKIERNEKYIKLMNNNIEIQNIVNIVNQICGLQKLDNLNEFVTYIGNYKVADIKNNIQKLDNDYKNIIKNIKMCKDELEETLKYTHYKNIQKYFENYLVNFEKYITDKYLINYEVLNNELSRMKNLGKTISFIIVFIIICLLLFNQL